MSITIASIYPPEAFTQFPVTGVIEILFDGEADAYSIRRAVALYGPDATSFLGPSMESKVGGYYSSFEEGLNSPGYDGQQSFSISIYRTDVDGLILDESRCYEPLDLAYTKVRIQPNGPLQENTQYKLFIAGESDIDSSYIAISSRSVMDAQAGVNAGTGYVESSGIYFGTDEDRVYIEVTSQGDNDTLVYDWWLDSSPLDIQSVRSYGGIQQLNAGVYVEFVGKDNDSFQIGDTFTIALKPATSLTTTYKLSFSTPSDRVTGVSDSMSSSPMGIGTTGPLTFLDRELKVISITPKEGASHQNPKTKQIIVKFNKVLDPTSINFDSIKLTRASSDGTEYPIDVPYSYMVNGVYLIINMLEI